MSKTENKRTPDQREQDLNRIAELLALGYTQKEIQAKIKTVSLSQIHYDIKDLRERWQSVQREKMNSVINESIFRFTVWEREALCAWRKSKKGQTIEQMKSIEKVRYKRFLGKVHESDEVIDEKTIRSAGDIACLDMAIKCRVMILKLYGIEPEDWEETINSVGEIEAEENQAPTLDIPDNERTTDT